MSELGAITRDMKENTVRGQYGDTRAYPESLLDAGGTRLLIICRKDARELLAAGKGKIYSGLNGAEQEGCKVCPLNHENREAINHHLPETMPAAAGKNRASIGLGDRLGIATPGHVQAVSGREVFPVFAQQSIRELNLTGRTFASVLDDATFGALQAGYREGFGADADHLKTEDDIRQVLDQGFSMITLDCSEKIDNTVESLGDDEVNGKYDRLPENIRARYESEYMDKSFSVGRSSITMEETSVKKNVLIYHEAIEYMEYIYREYISRIGRHIDFEISIDETETPTAPDAHFLIARELERRGIDATSVAPRFCGDFEKGVDYRGDLEQFEREFAVHVDIADAFGYRLSIHSGSDKFSVFPVIGRLTGGRFHVKTAGTNWLEAMSVVARKNPPLYRSMHSYSLEHFSEARAYYHVSTDLDAIAPLDSVKDDELPGYLDRDDPRQLIHITYGLLLQAKEEGRYLFRDDFFSTLIRHDSDYESGLARHIGRHLDLLGL